MINSAILMGRLTADPELRSTNTGINVTRFTIAVDKRTRAGEERQANFFNIVAWRQTAEFVCRYFQKGSMIAVRGPIDTNRYEDRDGNKRTSFEIVADEVSFCGSKAEGDKNTDNRQKGVQAATNAHNNARDPKNAQNARRNAQSNKDTQKNARYSDSREDDSYDVNDCWWEDEPPYGYGGY